MDKEDHLAPPTMVIDFDGTLAVHDVGDELCETFAEPGWRDVGAAWRRGELSLADAQRRMWASVTADRTRMEERARELGALREGADALFDAARRGALTLVLASGGFGLYIEAILGDRLSLFAATYYNRLEPGPAGPTLDFPHRDLARGPYAICKAAVCERHGAHLFAGDGSSDRSVAGVVPTVFAVEGSLLALHCNERGVPCVPFTTFDEVLAHLRVPAP
ncbi:MAG: haloacid dehalogenase-like hydrolase [Deltaproteobacteria bacterium]|nr:haloacid dehalogenase-like hydrolase [Deltaproteobacteria bacterium]